VPAKYSCRSTKRTWDGEEGPRGAERARAQRSGAPGAGDVGTGGEE
jgi:hypothetical protein